MVSQKLKKQVSQGVMLAACLSSSICLACTGIQLKAKDGTYITGRTVEFGTAIDLHGIVIPRNYSFTGTLPNGGKGVTYKSKYEAVGVTTFGEDGIVDGFNEKGLTVGMFYYAGYAKYTPLTAQNKSHALAPTELLNWIVTQFSNVDQVKKAIKSIVVVPTSFKAWGGVPQMHYIVYDKTGKSIVIEPTNGKLMVYDNPLGVFTNSPWFPWHLTNLVNYMNLKTFIPPSTKIGNYVLKQFGNGAGLLGLPGDFTPPSRFVRAAIFSTAALPMENSKQSAFEAFHILNQFDIPPGSVREGKGSGPGSVEITIATTVKDPGDGKYYFRTYANQNIRVVDLKKFNPVAKQLMWFSLDQKTPHATDISNKATTQAPQVKN